MKICQEASLPPHNSSKKSHPRRVLGRGGSRAAARPPRRRPFRRVRRAALAYLIRPIDFIKAKAHLLGWLDEAISIGVLIQKMSNRIAPKIEARADAQLDRWFAPNPDLSLP